VPGPDQGVEEVWRSLSGPGAGSGAGGYGSGAAAEVPA
jgi:hypothetical protein